MELASTDKSDGTKIKLFFYVIGEKVGKLMTLWSWMVSPPNIKV